MSSGMPRFVASRFAVPAGTIASGIACAGEDVEAALHGAVAAPGEDELGPLVEGPLHLLRRLAALRHLVPERIVDAGLLEDAPELDEPAPDRLAGVGDDGDARHRAPAVSSRRASAAPATRHAKTTTTIAAMPIGTAARASIGWCMPR